MNRFAAVIVLAACTEHGMTPIGNDATVTPPQIGCSNGHADKIKFAQNMSCSNDGGVEFCIPQGDQKLANAIAAISPTIRCAPGGGQANCSASPGLLLCSYPTSFPAQCITDHGAMNADTWSDMCDLAGLPEVLAIVPTIIPD